MKLAEKFNKPIITLIDTWGLPGLEAEERGGEKPLPAIFFEMIRLKCRLYV